MHKDHVRQFYEVLWNAHDKASISSILSEDVTFRGSLGEEKSGHVGFSEYVDMVHKALGNYTCIIDELVEEGDKEFEKSMKGKSILENSKKLNEYVMDNFSSEERNNLKVPKYFYQVTFNKPGGLVMPLIVEFTYDDGSTEMKKYPVQVWMKNDNTVTKTIASNKEITKVVVDPDLETADVDLSNNSWPKEETPNEFEQFKNNTDG